MRALSIRTLLVVVLVTAVAPLAVSLTRTLAAMRDLSVARSDQSAMALAVSTAEVVRRIVVDTEHRLLRLREALDNGLITAETCDERLRTLTQVDPHALNYLMVNRDGGLECTGVAGLAQTLPSVAHQVWYQRARDTRVLSAGVPVRGVRQDSWLITLAVPILVDGDFRGAVGMVVDLLEFQEVLQTQARTLPGSLLSITEGPLLVARSEGSDTLIGGRLPSSISGDPDSIRGFTLAPAADGGTRRWAYAAIPEVGWTVYAGIDESLIAGAERTHFTRASALAALVVFATAVLGLLVYSRITGALRWLTEFAEAALGGRALPATAAMPREIRSVAEKLREAARLRADAEAQVLQAQKMEAVGRLAAGIAHDYNNMLTVVNGQAQLALVDLPEGHRAREAVEDILEAGTRGAALTSRLLAFSRADQNPAVVFDINDVVRGLARLLSRLLSEAFVLEFDLADEALHVRADPSQLEQVLLNLAINARDASGASGTIRFVTDKLSARPPMSDEAPRLWARVRVTDTGHGMDEETRSRIFEPFFTTKGSASGTGLGLSVAYGIIHKAGGFLSVDSAVGKGTEIAVHLPLTGE